MREHLTGRIAMSRNISMTSTPPSNTAAGAAVWERLWQHSPSDAKDDVALERERRSTRWHAVVRHLETVFGSISGLRTVELGSGRGDLSALLAERGADVTLLDTNDTALGQAKHRFTRLGLSATYQQGDMLDLDETILNQSDVTLSSGVIEHFESDERTTVIQAHRDCVRPGGMVIISVPNARCLPYRLWKSYLELRGWWPYGMEIPYTKSELRHRAKAVGLRNVKVEATGLWQSVGAHWARSLLKIDVDWSHRKSWLDSLQGVNLLLFGTRTEHENRSCKA